MRFVCLGFHDERAWAALADGERRALLEETQAYEAILHDGGYIVATTALEPARAATTLRFQSDRVSVTDGPFAETKEQLGGFMILEADSREQAIQLLSKLPCMRIGGSVEIRPINEQVYGELEAHRGSTGVSPVPIEGKGVAPAATLPT